MEISLKDIGAIDRANIICDGVTIITGKNGSGKSSIAKSVTASISARFFSSNNLLTDCVRFVKQKLNYTVDTIVYYFRPRFYIDAHMKNLNKFYLDFAAAEKIVSSNYKPADLVGLVEDIGLVVEEMKNNKKLYLNYIEKNPKQERKQSPFYFEESEVIALFDSAIKDANYAISYLTQKIDMSKYVYETIKLELNDSFNNQLIPLSKEGADPEIRLSDGVKSFIYNHNSFANSNVLNGFGIENSYYISDGLVLDKINNRRVKKVTNSNSDVSPSYAALDEILMSSILPSNNIVYRSSLEDHFPKIFEIFNKIWPHEIIKRKNIMINSDTGLNILNEASGAKIFIILKQLFVNGHLNDKTLVIIDEPENHLHPEWQELFASLILLLSKSTGAKFVCITHSQTMLLALDVYSYKYDARKNFRVYFGHKDSNRFSLFEDCTNKVEYAHKMLTDPYIFMGTELINK